MMPLIPRRTSLRTSLLCAFIMATMTVPRMVSANPQLSVPDSSQAQFFESKPTPEFPLPQRVTQNADKLPQRVWTRAATRREPAWTKSAGKSSFTPRIRFTSASGAEQGKVILAVLTDSADDKAPESHNTNDENSTPSISIKEQLLNAIRTQREKSADGAAITMNPDSLTSPPAPRKPPTVDGFASNHDIETHSSDHSELPPTANTRIGLTRTLEADLKSTDPYVRERAQKYLRLEMQLLQLRANQAAKAEHSPESYTRQVAPEHVRTPAPPVPEHSVDVAPEIPANHTDHGHEAATTADDSRTVVAQEHTPQGNVEHDSEQNAAQRDSHPAAQSTSPNASVLDNMVVDGPIDRLGLANNLFAVGQYPLALEMYQQADSTALTSHQHFWVEYQAANCLRRMEKPAEASNLYRRLADQPEAGWLSTQARWWVETLEQIRLLEKMLAEHAIDPQPAAVNKSKLKESKHDEHLH